ncbi:MAG: HAMP domain-containing protein [Archangiaceae bacterium]|nr:HAMP domain-containing protein [Archangiaceae bacterium]
MSQPKIRTAADEISAADARALMRVLASVKKGDFSVRLPHDRPGAFGRVCETLNEIVELNERLATELSKMQVTVGEEGRIGRRAAVPQAQGAWAGSVQSINALVYGLVQPTQEMGRVIRAVAAGDLSQRATTDIDGRPLKGEFLRTTQLVNGMVETLSSFASEVTRVAREVGTEGRLGGQATVRNVGGTWKDLTDNVNSMASNLTSQVRNVAEVTTAVARGDLTKKITVDVRGEMLELKATINTMVDQLSSFASEVTRVAREVGTEGKLGGQAQVQGVGGTWKDLTDNVNSMATNLTTQVRNIAEVTTAVATGDLSKKMTVDARGEILELKRTFNTMVEQLQSFASEVTRVAREVGTEGKLGGQAHVREVGGTWKNLTENVNSMASNLTSQVRNIAEVTTAVAQGDLSKKITVDARGEILELKQTINTMVDQLRSFAAEVTRVGREVGTDGKLGGQAVVKGVGGTWKDLTDNVNSMATNLTVQVRAIAEVTTAVQRGDLSKKIQVDARGEILELKNTINTMVDQLSSFASEVTRVAREVGTEGKLGGQAVVRGVAGTWKDLTDNVNYMATNLTTQVREIAKVVTHVANGDLKRKLVVSAQGEIALLADTINNMTETLALFADQVSSVAREVGIEGKLGGQARVPGTAGSWKDLTGNVNLLAANLTTQVRAIATVATAVAKGDLTRSISVDAQGEVAALKDNINEMIRNLKETTQKNTEQDWLKTNLTRIARVLQGQRDLQTVSRVILSELAPLVGAQHAAFFGAETREDGVDVLRLLAGYALLQREGFTETLRFGEGLVGQCAIDKEPIILLGTPREYVRIGSALGELPATNIVVLPVLFEGDIKAVVEMASVFPFSEVHLNFLKQVTESIGVVLNTIQANMRTESLLKQSQTLAEVLRSTNEELQEKAQLLSEQKDEVERTNEEVELARRALEEKAEQLALTSKYKSEFLANMSHELRTPLNSLLLLAQSLSENTDGNLSSRQVEYARTIHASGADLMELINDILDLSKIESGTMAISTAPVRFKELERFTERTFRQVAAGKRLEFAIEASEDLPEALETDGKRLQQVLRNLLSNAFKFTESGRVTLHLSLAKGGFSPQHPVLSTASGVIAFAVSDTGIGIPRDKHEIIFEAFQQADGTTSRKYGGTGLGLSISRDIAKLLGGEIRLQSEPGRGSIFTLYLPVEYAAQNRPQREVPAAVVWPSGHAAQPRPSAPIAKPAGLPPPNASPPVALRTDEADDDRGNIVVGDRVLVVVTDRLEWRQQLAATATELGLKLYQPASGDAAVKAARELNPTAVVVDLSAKDQAGWLTLERIAHGAETLHVPVVTLGTPVERFRALDHGAAQHWSMSPNIASGVMLSTLEGLTHVKPPGVLVVEPDPGVRQQLIELLGGDGVRLTASASVDEAVRAMGADTFQAMVLRSGALSEQALARLQKSRVELGAPPCPVVAWCEQEPRSNETAPLLALADGHVLKLARSTERLLEETCIAARRSARGLSETQRQALGRAREKNPRLAGRTVLAVDDDVRNIFALTAILERHGLKMYFAESGQSGISMLKRQPDVDVVLMDVMMPEMDGYQAVRAIRAMPQFTRLPIIALTAKAMKGDREKCLASGASDYIAKPVDVEKLLAMLRVWLEQPRPPTPRADAAEVRPEAR